MEVLTAPPGLEEDVPSAGTGAGAAGAAGAGTRRKLFDPHLDQEAIEAGLASGEDRAVPVVNSCGATHGCDGCVITVATGARHHG